MTKRFSYRRGDDLVCEFSLAFNEEGDVRLTRGAPALESNERELRMYLTIPVSIFRRPQLSARVEISDTPAPDMVIDVEAARSALRDAIGADVALHVVQPDATS